MHLGNCFSAQGYPRSFTMPLKKVNHQRDEHRCRGNFAAGSGLGWNWVLGAKADRIADALILQRPTKDFSHIM